MDRRHTRRALAHGASAAFMLSCGLDGVSARTPPLASKGIGLARAEWEAIYGTGEPLQTLIAYTDPVHRGPVYVGLDDGGRVGFVELRWEQASQAGGLSQELAGNQVRGLLPADARLDESYELHATAGGPIAIRSQRWVSPALGRVTGGRESILILYQEQPSRLNPGSNPIIAVMAATIAVEEGERRHVREPGRDARRPMV